MGVGKNMVSSIRYWLRAFGLINQSGELLPLADFIFDTETGRDPFVEDVQTLWLLHWNLIYSNYASLYRYVFLNFHKERKMFNKENIFKFLRRKNDEKPFGGGVWNDNTISKDIAMLLRMYVSPNGSQNDDYCATLIDLNLIRRVGKDSYEFNYPAKAKISPLTFLYAVNKISNGSQVVEFDKLLELALIFCLSQGELYDIFSRLTEINPNISFVNSAGEQLFAVKQDFNGFDILDMYYKS